MEKDDYCKKIRSDCEKAGTYRPFFDSVIDTLAGILARRDEAEQQFIKSGAHPVIAYTNKGGATNFVANPALQVVRGLEADALAYWRDLGLTPAGLRRINEDNLKERKRSALADALKELEKA